MAPRPERYGRWIPAGPGGSGASLLLPGSRAFPVSDGLLGRLTGAREAAVAEVDEADRDRLMKYLPESPDLLGDGCGGE